MPCKQTIIGLVLLGAASTFGLKAYGVCQDTGLHLQVLGSGGPAASDGRASSAYVLWVDGHSRVLVDAGGGSKNLFHQSGADLNDIDLIALSHFHPDHSAELPAILWPVGGTFTLSGPVAGGIYPGVEAYARNLFGAGGVFAVLRDRLDYRAVEVSVNSGRVTAVRESGELRVTGTGVPHGNVPTVGYRIDQGDSSIVFASDQNGSDDTFIDFASGADVLVIHLTANEDSTGLMVELHATPSVWGQMAAAAGVGEVVVSHISNPEPEQLAENLAILSEYYTGPVTVAEDLMCIEVD